MKKYIILTFMLVALITLVIFSKNNKKITGLSVDQINQEYNLYKIDGGEVYLNEDYNYNKKILVQGADHKTFRVAGFCLPKRHYFIDQNHVYINQNKAENIDRQTFEYLGSFIIPNSEVSSSVSYAKDNKNIYVFCGELLEGADNNSFKVLDYGYAKDNKNIYGSSYGYAIEGINYKTFRLLNDGYATDGNNILFYGRKIPNVDIKTFETMKDFLSRDKNNLYYYGYKVDNVKSEDCLNIDINECITRINNHQ